MGSSEPDVPPSAAHLCMRWVAGGVCRAQFCPDCERCNCEPRPVPPLPQTQEAERHKLWCASLVRYGKLCDCVTPPSVPSEEPVILPDGCDPTPFLPSTEIRPMAVTDPGEYGRRLARSMATPPDEPLDAETEAQLHEAFCAIFPSTGGNTEALDAKIEARVSPILCALVRDVRRPVEQELAEAQQWLDAEPDWKAKYMDAYVALEKQLSEARQALGHANDMCAGLSVEADVLRDRAEAAERERDEAKARVSEVELSCLAHFQRDHLEGDGPEIDRWRWKVAVLEQRGAGLIQALTEIAAFTGDLGGFNVEAVRIAHAALDGWAKRGTP